MAPTRKSSAATPPTTTPTMSPTLLSLPDFAGQGSFSKAMAAKVPPAPSHCSAAIIFGVQPEEGLKHLSLKTDGGMSPSTALVTLLTSVEHTAFQDPVHLSSHAPLGLAFACNKRRLYGGADSERFCNRESTLILRDAREIPLNSDAGLGSRLRFSLLGIVTEIGAAGGT